MADCGDLRWLLYFNGVTGIVVICDVNRDWPILRPKPQSCALVDVCADMAQSNQACLLITLATVLEPHSR